MEVDALGGEFNAFTSKEYTGYYVRCAADHRDQALDVLVDMLRNSKFEAEEIEREKGVIVEEMNMYFDTPRDFIGGVYDHAPLRRPAARLGHHRAQGDGPGGDARHIPRVRRPLVQAGTDGRRRGRQARRRLRRLDRAPARRPRAGRKPARPPRSCRTETPSDARSTEGLGPGAPLPRSTQLPDRAPGPLGAAAARDRARAGMSSRLFTEVRERRGLAYYVYATTRATRMPARSTRRRASTSTGARRRSRRSSASSAGSPRSRSPQTSSRRRGRSPRAASSSGSRARRG